VFRRKVIGQKLHVPHGVHAITEYGTQLYVCGNKGQSKLIQRTVNGHCANITFKSRKYKYDELVGRKGWEL
jgi:hypothetical protein